MSCVLLSIVIYFFWYSDYVDMISWNTMVNDLPIVHAVPGRVIPTCQILNMGVYIKIRLDYTETECGT